MHPQWVSLPGSGSSHPTGKERMLVNRGILYHTTLLRQHHHKEELLSLHQSRQDKLISLPDIENAHKDISHNGDVGENWDFSKVQLDNWHSLPCSISYLKAGQDEVHSFFWGKDLEEAVTGQQNEPTIQGRNNKYILIANAIEWPVTEE